MTQFTQFLHLFTWEFQILEKNDSQHYKTYEKWNFSNAFAADMGNILELFVLNMPVLNSINTRDSTVLF